jgi:hypothetical protein
VSEQSRPEIGTFVVANGIRTNYLEAGSTIPSSWYTARVPELRRTRTGG